jgi:NAD-dependent dihydropyrimidine dehydrogenase PreA subunit
LKKFEYIKDVSSLALDQAKCSGCGMCMIVCPHSVFERENGKARIGNRDLCMECSACATNCPEEAISVLPGVGCAAAVISWFLGVKITGCSCEIEQEGEATKEAGCCNTSCGC